MSDFQTVELGIGTDDDADATAAYAALSRVEAEMGELREEAWNVVAWNETQAHGLLLSAIAGLRSVLQSHEAGTS